MSNFIYKPLIERAYNSLRFTILKAVEESNDLKEQAYLDSKGIPTIGLGMNLRDQKVREAVID
jgi:GH24 family phage-related lysozyme (muramidase)